LKFDAAKIGRSLLVILNPLGMRHEIIGSLCGFKQGKQTLARSTGLQAKAAFVATAQQFGKQQTWDAAQSGGTLDYAQPTPPP
jgi:hypothetical protein